MWSGVCCRGVWRLLAHLSSAGVFKGLAATPAAKKRFFNDDRGKTDQEQGKDDAEYDAKARADTEKIFKHHEDSPPLHALQRLIRGPFGRRDTVI